MTEGETFIIIFLGNGFPLLHVTAVNSITFSTLYKMENKWKQHMLALVLMAIEPVLVKDGI